MKKFHGLGPKKKPFLVPTFFYRIFSSNAIALWCRPLLDISAECWRGNAMLPWCRPLTNMATEYWRGNAFYRRFLHGYIQWPHASCSSTALPVHALLSSSTLPPHVTGSNTCLMTLFLIHLPNAMGGKGCFRGNMPGHTMWSPALLVTRLNATYNCPWANGSGCSETPTCFRDWPYDLLIVIAKARRTGNWYRRKGVYSSFESGGVRGILGIK